MPDTTILTVNWNCSAMIEQFMANALSKADKSDKLKLLVIDNTNGSDGLIYKLPEKCAIPCEIHKLDTNGLSGSRGHAAGLDLGLGLIDTEYTLVVDPDIYIFKDKWDSFCIDLLSKTGSVAVGVPYPPWKTGKYHNFPSPPFSFFRTDFLKDINATWKPFASSRTGHFCHFLLRQIGRLGPIVTRKTFTHSAMIRCYSKFAEKALGIFSHDTGCIIAATAKRKGSKSIVFDTVTENDIHLVPESGLEVFKELAGHYELFYFQGSPFLVHKYGSGGIPWRTERGHDEANWRKTIEQMEAFSGDNN